MALLFMVADVIVCSTSVGCDLVCLVPLFMAYTCASVSEKTCSTTLFHGLTRCYETQRTQRTQKNFLLNKMTFLNYWYNRSLWSELQWLPLWKTTIFLKAVSQSLHSIFCGKHSFFTKIHGGELCGKCLYACISLW